MTIDDIQTHRGRVLRRIADSNSLVEPGSGAGPNQFVPAYSVTNRSFAATLKQRLIDGNINVQTYHERLCTRFFVTRDNLATALRIRELLLAEKPDTKPRKFSRDYDSVFLLAPFTLLAAFLTYLSPTISDWAWIGVVTTGISAMMFLERLNRQYRIHLGSHWTIQDLLLATATVAINVVVWQILL